MSAPLITAYGHGTHGDFLAAIVTTTLRDLRPDDHIAIRAAFAATDSILRDRLAEHTDGEIGPLGVVRSRATGAPVSGGVRVTVLWPDSGQIAHVGGPGHTFENHTEYTRFLDTDRTLTADDFVTVASGQTLFLPPHEPAAAAIGYTRSLGDFHLRRYGLIAIPTIVGATTTTTR